MCVRGEEEGLTKGLSTQPQTDFLEFVSRMLYYKNNTAIMMH
jgi:hypothetical protein